MGETRIPCALNPRLLRVGMAAAAIPPMPRSTDPVDIKALVTPSPDDQKVARRLEQAGVQVLLAEWLGPSGMAQYCGPRLPPSPSRCEVCGGLAPYNRDYCCAEHHRTGAARRRFAQHGAVLRDLVRTSGIGELLPADVPTSDADADAWVRCALRVVLLAGDAVDPTDIRFIRKLRIELRRYGVDDTEIEKQRTRLMGLFSWLTTDTKRSIPCRYSVRNPSFDCHVWMPDRKLGVESNYDGYGTFCGHDYFDLVYALNKTHPQMKEYVGGVEDREYGITFVGLGERGELASPGLFPQFTEHDVRPPDEAFHTPPERCPAQGIFYDE